MFRRVLFILLLSLSIVSDALANVKHVAVLEFRGVDVNQAILMKLSDQPRVAASEVLPKDQYLIMTRENMTEILSDMGKDASCMEGQCEIEVGRNVGADYVMTGDVMKVDGTYFLTLKLYDTLSGGILKAGSVEADTFKDLLHQTAETSMDLFREGLEIQAPTFTVGIVTEPSAATVTIDGSMVCRSTPCKLSVQQGKHSIQIDKSGYATIERSISIVKDQVFREVLKSEPGYLSLTSTPKGALVDVDQNEVGQTPISKYRLDPGTHTIRVRHDCYEPSQFSVLVNSGKSVSRNVSLSTVSVPIDITLSESSVTGDVYIDGQMVGRTPYQGTTDLCSRQAIVKVGGQRYTKALHLKEGQNFVQMIVPAAKVAPQYTQSNYDTPDYDADWFVASRYDDMMIVATGTRYEPMFNMTVAVPSGIDIEIARELARRLGKSDVRFVKSSSARLSAKKEEVDFAIAAISITAERQAIHLFSNPYFETGQVIVMRDVGQYGYGDLNSKTCGYHSPLYKSILKRHGCTLKKYSSSTAVMNALRNGSIDYIILEEQSVPDEFWKSSIVSSDAYGIVFPNSAYGLKREVDQHLREMEQNGFITGLKHKYNVH